MNLIVRRAESEDAQGIVKLFSEDGNPHNWTFEKWSYYYEQYTEGKTVAFVAEIDKEIVGHYGLFPIVVDKNKVYMGAHAYVSASVRGLAVISSLMKSLDRFCISEKIPFIVGFANARFTIVKNKLFKWQTPFYMSFVVEKEFKSTCFNNRPFIFEYTDEWLEWRFKEKKSPIISKYINSDNNIVHQLLYAKGSFTAKDFNLNYFEGWSPSGYIINQSEGFSQPFSIKIYDKNWTGPDLLDPDNWFIQMGDSDTFIYKAIE